MILLMIHTKSRLAHCVYGGLFPALLVGHYRRNIHERNSRKQGSFSPVLVTLATNKLRIIVPPGKSPGCRKKTEETQNCTACS